jgi:murein DD-endopeptidase MepM/ murein hydrolase activator NlpD
VHPDRIVVNPVAAEGTFDPSGDGNFDISKDGGAGKSFDSSGGGSGGHGTKGSGGKGSGSGGGGGNGSGAGGAGSGSGSSSGGVPQFGGDGSGELPAGTREVSLAGPPTSGNVGVLTDVNGDGVPDQGTVLVAITGDGPLYTCPVYGRGHYSSSFGAYRPGPPVHAHQGNDVVTDFGAPILAPFDGTAVPVQSGLGGLGVKVFGADGYVYNAHLAGYGTLGAVKTGDIIGFVGQTGNARYTVPHDHFEWHPGNGPAVDPFPYLNEVCA